MVRTFTLGGRFDKAIDGFRIECFGGLRLAKARSRCVVGTLAGLESPDFYGRFAALLRLGLPSVASAFARWVARSAGWEGDMSPRSALIDSRCWTRTRSSLPLDEEAVYGDAFFGG